MDHVGQLVDDYCKKVTKVMTPFLIALWIFIVSCFILTGLYFVTIYLGYFYTVIINNTDDATGCSEDSVKDYLDKNITDKSLWICSNNCSHKTLNSFYGMCFVMGLLTWILVIPLGISGIICTVILIILTVDIARKYCLFNVQLPQQVEQ